MLANSLKTLLLGDVYADPGCRVLFNKLGALIKKYDADFVIANGENACNGFGLSVDNMQMLFALGVNVITSGNHIWQKPEIFPYLDSEPNLLRPANYSSVAQGHGYTIVNGIGVLNLQGRINMSPIEDPFSVARVCVDELSKKVKTIFVDFHAESSEEKEALAYFLDGKVTAVVGTHIHVQTADERLLPGKTAYITDLGMCGPSDSVIGCDTALAIQRQKTQMPIKAQSPDNPAVIMGVVVESDPQTGRALSITRICE